jgi:hypothetical protein
VLFDVRTLITHAERMSAVDRRKSSNRQPFNKEQIMPDLAVLAISQVFVACSGLLIYLYM